MPERTGKRRLILASASPRRAELLRQHGYDFEVVVAPAEEPVLPRHSHTPEEQAEALSEFKAQAVAQIVADGVILAADTIAARNGVIFGKPLDKADAARIIRSIAGTRHDVITGVTLWDAATGDRVVRHDRTSVFMRALSHEELRAYLQTGAWQGKAGAYGIQDFGDAFVDRIEGSFTNVVGLPMELVSAMLESRGIRPSVP